MFKRIKRWLKARVSKYYELKIKFDELDRYRAKLEHHNTALQNHNVNIQDKLNFLLKIANESKLLIVIEILAHYETEVERLRKRKEHPIRIELMDKALTALTHLIACDDPKAIDPRNDNIFFWRNTKEILHDLYLWR